MASRHDLIFLASFKKISLLYGLSHVQQAYLFSLLFGYARRGPPTGKCARSKALRIAKKNGTAITSATIAFVKVAANFVTIASAAAYGADPTKISFTNEYPKYRTQ